MILVVELMDEGTGHAPGNSAWTQVIAAAAPDQPVRVVASPLHLAALQADPHLAAFANVSFHEIAIPTVHRQQVNVASWRRFRQEFAALRAVLADVPRSEPCLIVLAQAAPTAAFAARLVGLIERRALGVQVVLHGFLNAILGWRSRLPWQRRFDLRGLLTAAPRNVRFLALDPSIRAELVALIPAAEGRVDVLPLPINRAETAAWRPVRLEPPIRIGLVGQTTAAKGIGPFLEAARLLKARYGDAVEFHVVGRRFPDTPKEALAVLARPIPEGWMSRAEFVERIAPLHYVCLPLQPFYYRLSPSGALIDAITWLKPVVATDLPIVAEAFRQGGDIGERIGDPAQLPEVLAALIERADADRYARQVEALRRLRDRRSPQALVPTYRDILERGFGALLNTSCPPAAGRPGRTSQPSTAAGDTAQPLPPQ